MKIELWTTSTCPYCVRAKELLRARGLAFEEHLMDADPIGLAKAKQKWGHPTVPIVVIDGQLVGGSTELARKLG
jgi:glutaredoxin 3